MSDSITKEGFTIPVEDWDGITRYGKKTTTYVAQITGPGTQFPLERKFKKRTASSKEDGVVTLPVKDGVYELRDWPAGERRVRYYQVRSLTVKELPETADDDDVLEAVAASDSGEWGEIFDVPDATGVTSTVDVLVACDEAQKELSSGVIRLRSGEDTLFDEEDVAMAIDRIRRVVERL